MTMPKNFGFAYDLDVKSNKVFELAYEDFFILYENVKNEIGGQKFYYKTE